MEIQGQAKREDDEGREVEDQQRESQGRAQFLRRVPGELASEEESRPDRAGDEQEEQKYEAAPHGNTSPRPFLRGPRDTRQLGREQGHGRLRALPAHGGAGRRTGAPAEGRLAIRGDPTSRRMESSPTSCATSDVLRP